MLRQSFVVQSLSCVHVVHVDGLFALFSAKSNLQLHGFAGAFEYSAARSPLRHTCIAQLGTVKAPVSASNTSTPAGGVLVPVNSPMKFAVFASVITLLAFTAA